MSTFTPPWTRPWRTLTASERLLELRHGPSTTTTSYCSTPSPLALFLSVLADCLAGGVGGLLIVFGEGNTFFSPHLAKRFSPVDQMADRLSHIPPQYLRMLS